MRAKPSSASQPVGKLRAGRQHHYRIEWYVAAQRPLVGVHATSNPFHRPVDDPLLPVFGVPDGSLETEQVRPSVSLVDADQSFPRKYFGKHLLLEFLGTEIHDRGEADDQTTQNTCKMLFRSRRQ